MCPSVLPPNMNVLRLNIYEALNLNVGHHLGNQKDPQKLPLHRAFSVFIFDPSQHYKMLIQQRAHHKITFPSLWSNACCSHPLVNDDNILTAMRRKLKQELGISSDGII